MNHVLISMKKEWRLWLVALIFFTRMPVKVADFKESDLNRSGKYFPLVGILVGLVAAAVFGLGVMLLPFQLAVLASMGASIWLTGAFHEDGLADAADGLGGSWEKEQVLTIMQDSRLGTYGAIALFMILLTKFEALAHLSAPLLPGIMLAGHSLSRFAALLVIYTQNYVRPNGKAKPLATQLTRQELVLSGCFGLLPLLLLSHRLWLGLVPVVVVWLWFSHKLKKRLGGYTGDCLGAMQQLCEVAFYLGVLVWSIP
jgi:adenosylcobinamide-GDP ribazoletransferase